MSYLPTHSEPLPGDVSEPGESGVEGEGRLRRVSWGTIVRNRWIILATTVTVVAITVGLTRLVVPVYEGSSTLRIEEKEPNLPEVFRTGLPGVSRIPTEMEELRSRTLAADVVTDLGLRLTLIEPRAVARSGLMSDVRVSDSAETGEYRLIRGQNRNVHLVREGPDTRRARYALGEKIEFGGFSFVLTPVASEYSTIRFRVETQMAAAKSVAAAVGVTQPSRDVDVVRVSYRSPDRELAWRVPQALVTHYVAQRQELQTHDTRSTIEFLRQQISTISTQLASSERDLMKYRERFDVINPQAEATGQVGRLVSMQTQRGLLENERTALMALLTDVDATAVGHKPGDPSPYRRLLAFPTLLQSQAATGLLLSLSTAEDQRQVLLTRRTSQDADVQALDRRIGELERELRAMAATYLQGLTDQVQALDDGLKDFQGQLRSIPEKELQYARLERQPKVLDGVYTMLQTRLKEAEVAAAVRDPSVRVVDAAIPPGRPVWPRPLMNAVAALVCGLLLGLAVTFAREYRDGAVRSRRDVFGSTGLPVLGMIPRIVSKKGPVALIAERTRRPIDRTPPAPPPPPPQVPQRRSYTFLDSGHEPVPQESLGTHSAEQKRPPADKVALTISRLAGPVAEAYGVLQTNIAFSRRDVPAKTLVITSPLSGDGKTTTVVNLALSLTQRGLRVLLIDADLRRGVMHTVFGTARENGLSDVLSGRSAFEKVRRSVLVGDRGVLDYLTTGKLYAGNHGLVASDAMRNLMTQAREEYDVVIVDTPPINIITDAALLGTNADGVVLVARAGVTEAVALSYAVEQLRRVRAPLLGVILNDIDMQRDATYDTAYKYLRGYEYNVSDS